MIKRLVRRFDADLINELQAVASTAAMPKTRARTRREASMADATEFREWLQHLPSEQREQALRESVQTIHDQVYITHPTKIPSIVFPKLFTPRRHLRIVEELNKAALKDAGVAPKESKELESEWDCAYHTTLSALVGRALGAEPNITTQSFFTKTGEHAKHVFALFTPPGMNQPSIVSDVNLKRVLPASEHAIRLQKKLAAAGYIPTGLPHTATSANSARALVFGKLAESLMQKSESLADAISVTHKAIEYDPLNPHNYELLGSIHGRKGSWVRAEEAYRRAHELSPGDPTHYDNLGYALRGQRRFNDARESYNEAIRLDPAGPMHHLGLSRAAYAQAEARGFSESKSVLEEAANSARSAARLAPGIAEAHGALGRALFRLAAHHEYGDARGKLYQEAEASLKEALRRGAREPEYYEAMGNLLNWQDRGKEAAKYWRKWQKLKKA